MKIYTADRETGTFIEECRSVSEAREFIADYEAMDMQDGTFEPDFYDIVDENHCSIFADRQCSTYIVTMKGRRKNAKRHVVNHYGRTEYFGTYEAAKRVADILSKNYITEVLTANFKPVDEFGRVIKEV